MTDINMINVNLIYDAKAFAWYPSRVLFTRREEETRVPKVLGLAGVFLWLIALLVIVGPAAPSLAYKLVPRLTESVAEKLGSDAAVAKSEFGAELYVEPVALPPYEDSLPKENMLVIEKIGFNSEISTDPDWVETMKKGPWMVPDYGVPTERGLPVILAAHRFGYIYWSNQFRREHSFYNLPKLGVGDTFNIVWDRRKYTYEIYEGYTDEAIRESSYGADVILYTCEVLNSDRRIVRLARRIEV